MSKGILSRLISALIGEPKETREESRKENAPESAGTTSEAKDWVPELAIKHAEKMPEITPHKSEVPAQKKTPETMAPEKEHGIKSMLERAYNKAVRSFAERFNSYDLVITGPIVAALIIALLYFTPLFSFIKAFLVVFVLIIVAAISKVTQKLFPVVVGFDLCLFFTVLAAVAYHPIAGLAVGVISSALGSMTRGQYDMDKVIVPMLGYAAVSLMVPIISGMSIVSAGILMAGAYSIMMSVAFWFIMHSISNTATFLFTSLGFNYWLFASYGESMLNFMKL